MRNAGTIRAFREPSRRNSAGCVRGARRLFPRDVPRAAPETYSEPALVRKIDQEGRINQRTSRERRRSCEQLSFTTCRNACASSSDREGTVSRWARMAAPLAEEPASWISRLINLENEALRLTRSIHRDITTGLSSLVIAAGRARATPRQASEHHSDRSDPYWIRLRRR